MERLADHGVYLRTLAYGTHRTTCPRCKKMSNRNNQRETIEKRLEMYSWPEPNSGCTLWSGPLAARGYGKITEAGITHLVHRFVWSRANGRDVPQGMVVRHRCDNVACINPDHLLIGQQKDNVADMDERGRRVSCMGARNPGAKLTVAQAIAIRSDRRRSGEVAREFGIISLTVWEIRSGRKWRHLGGPVEHLRCDKGGRNRGTRPSGNTTDSVSQV